MKYCNDCIGLGGIWIHSENDPSYWKTCESCKGTGLDVIHIQIKTDDTWICLTCRSYRQINRNTIIVNDVIIVFKNIIDKIDEMME